MKRRLRFAATLLGVRARPLGFLAAVAAAKAATKRVTCEERAGVTRIIRAPSPRLAGQRGLSENVEKTPHYFFLINLIVKRNKYRGGTSDATTPSSLIILLFMMSINDFFSLETGHIRRSKITRDQRTYGATDGPTDGPTDGHDLLWRCIVASKKGKKEQ